MPLLDNRFFLNGILLFGVGFCSILVYHCKNPNFESDYYNPEVLATHYNGEAFVGSETCLECHADIYAEHLKTAHHRTSALASDSTILGSFEPESNILDLEYSKFTMERKSDTFYQYTEYKNRLKKNPPATFDIVIGSGVRGQSYLTWKDDKLFQLQSSYHKPADSWVNSPGFPTYAIERPVRDGCIKCHVTFAQNLNLGEGNQYNREQIMYGIECERCHRPAAKHVIFHRKHPEVKTANFMIAIDSLTRQQRLDVCAQCHSGLQNQLLKGTPFSYVTGENLSEFSRNATPVSASQTLDVHGNQYGLLTRSECFKQTAAMDCTTCHDPHKNQHGNAAYFNQKCMQCHTKNQKRLTEAQNHFEIAGTDCIACHMPKMRSQSISIKLTDKDSIASSFSIRTHLIKVYGKDSRTIP